MNGIKVMGRGTKNWGWERATNGAFPLQYLQTVITVPSSGCRNSLFMALRVCSTSVINGSAHHRHSGRKPRRMTRRVSSFTCLSVLRLYGAWKGAITDTIVKRSDMLNAIIRHAPTGLSGCQWVQSSGTYEATDMLAVSHRRETWSVWGIIHFCF